MAVTELAVFSPSRFLVDLQETCATISAPYSESTVQSVLKAYNDSFHNGAVVLRATDRPGDALNFRFYERRPVDTVTIAIANGLLKEDNPLAKLITSWSSLYDGSVQCCDFDSQKGLRKTWIYLGGLRPLDDILNARDVPESIRRHGPALHARGLNLVSFVAGDYYSNTVNIYFRPPGPLSDDKAAQLVGLAGCPPPSQGEIDEMRSLLNPTKISFAVTMQLATGAITRVSIYAINMPSGEFPEMGERLGRFFKAPSYDEEEANTVGWSFGTGGKKYMKADRSYCGQVLSLMRGWNCPSKAE